MKTMERHEIDLEKHIEILNSRRNRLPINCIEIGGGRYNITKKWLKLIYLPNKHKFERPSLLWKVSREILTPVLVDIDINTTDKPTKNVVECYMRIIGFIMNEFTKIYSGKVRITATRRTAAYQKNNGKWHTGFHLYIHGRYSLDQSQTLRSLVMANCQLGKECADSWGIPITEDDTQIYDTALADRANGLLFIGCNKPDMVVGPHFVFYTDEWENGWVHKNQLNKNPNWYLTDEDTKTKYIEDLCDLYSFIFTNPPPQTP